MDEQTVIVSCAGCQGDDEAILKWTKDPDEVGVTTCVDLVIKIFPS